MYRILKMIDFDLVFDRRKETGKNSPTGLIEIRASLRGARMHREYSTKIRVKPSEWSEKDKRVTYKNKDADLHNRILIKHLKGLSDLQYEKEYKKQPFTFDDVKAHFRPKEEKTNSFISFIKSEIETDRSVTTKTKAQHQNTLNILQKFKVEDILFSDLSFALIDKFNNHLIERKYRQNTIHKHHKNLKKFIGLAIKKEFTEIKNPYDKYKVKSEQKPRDILNMAEVDALAKLIFNKNAEKLAQVRDMFLFACYTGLRISDVCVHLAIQVLTA